MLVCDKLQRYQHINSWGNYIASISMWLKLEGVSENHSLPSPMISLVTSNLEDGKEWLVKPIEIASWLVLVIRGLSTEDLHPQQGKYKNEQHQ